MANCSASEGARVHTSWADLLPSESLSWSWILGREQRNMFESECMFFGSSGSKSWSQIGPRRSNTPPMCSEHFEHMLSCSIPTTSWTFTDFATFARGSSKTLRRSQRQEKIQKCDLKGSIPKWPLKNVSNAPLPLFVTWKSHVGHGNRFGFFVRPPKMMLLLPRFWGSDPRL